MPILQATALDLITSSMRLVNAVAAGEPPTAAEANDALLVLNQMLDAWNAERLTIYAEQSNDFPFVLGQQTYALGNGGDFNMDRPVRITGMSAILLNNPSNPLEEPITMYTVKDWQEKLPVKVVSGSFPLICYDDGAFPLRNLNFWPIPSQQNNVRIYSWQALSFASALTTVISLPPGYSEAVRYNLAVRLSAEFGTPLSPAVQGIAVESLAKIKTMNAPELSLKTDLSPNADGYNYRADLFGMGF